MPVDGISGLVRSSNENVVVAAVYPNASGPAPVAPNRFAAQPARARNRNSVVRETRSATIETGQSISSPIQTRPGWNYKKNTEKVAISILRLTRLLSRIRRAAAGKALDRSRKLPDAQPRCS